MLDSFTIWKIHLYTNVMHWLSIFNPHRHSFPEPVLVQIKGSLPQNFEPWESDHLHLSSFYFLNKKIPIHKLRRTGRMLGIALEIQNGIGPYG